MRMRSGPRSGQQRETRDRGHVTAEAPGAGPRADYGLPPAAPPPRVPPAPGNVGRPAASRVSARHHPARIM